MPQSRTSKAAKHPLFKPASRRMEQGAAATTIINRITAGRAVPSWATKAAKIKLPAATTLKRKK